ncbi:hypothetical protein GGF43_001489 [Coemansia sp. RSA 2618]|nr:hypothetical protein GGF43_001489 [Coemansia sp. RSA 2618]
MASIGTLIGPTVNQRNYKARIVANLLNVKLDITPNFEMNVDNKKPEFLAKFPLGKVPVFEGTNDFKLTDSSAIAYYVAMKAANSAELLGTTDEERAEILQFAFFAEADYSPAQGGALYPVLGYMPYVKPAVQAAEQQLERFLGVLNTVLVDRTFLVGERVTMADVIVTCDLAMAFTYFLEASGRKQFRNVTRYFKTMIGQPAFKAIFGAFTFCTARAKPAAPAKKEKKEKKPEAPKKAEKKPAPKKEEDEEEAKPAPKPKSKLDLLPPTSMPLDSWKRFYSNNETKPDAMNWLWENFDAEGYSFWKVDYKYNDELAKCFMTNNLIGGFFNRLERARKYAFGCLLTLGKDDDNQIWGYFIVRGKEIPEEVTDAADYESFEWTAADHTDAKTKAEIEDCFAWEGPSLPRECYDGKVFK